MAPTQLEPLLKGETGRNTRGLLRLIILCTIAGAAVASRLFSVISTSDPTIAVVSITHCIELHQRPMGLTLLVCRV